MPATDDLGNKLPGDHEFDAGNQQEVMRTTDDSEATLRAFYDHSPVLMGLTEILGDGDILHVYDNPATCQFFNVPAGATAGKRALSQLGASPEAVRLWREAYLRCESTGRAVRLEHQYQGPHGLRWLSAQVGRVGPGRFGPTRFCYVAEDITEQRTAIEALRTSEAEYRWLFEAAGVGNAEILLASGRFVRVNRRYCELTGYTEAELLGLTFTDITHPDDRQRNLEMIGPFMAEQAAKFAIEKRYVRKDGQVVWVHLTGTLIRDESGIPVRMLGSAQDVTERRQAEQALRFQLDLTRSITDNATTAIFMMDKQSRCTFMNPAAERMTGFSFEEVSGGILHDFIHHHHPDGRPYPMPECPIDRALPEHYEVRDHEDAFIRKNGEFFPVLCNARVIYKDGQAVGTVIEVRDITTERAAAEDLRRQTARATRLVESNIVGVIFADRERIKEANDAFLAMVGYSRTDLEAGRLTWRVMTPLESADANEQAFNELAQKGIPHLSQKEFFRQDGSRVPVLLAAAVVDGDPSEWVGFVQDISRIKAAEEELRETDRRKDEFLATLAHELRNPLAPIRNAVQTLKAKGTSDPDLVWGRDVIERQVSHMARLLDDLLDVSRITRKKLELRKAQVTLAEVVEGAVETSRPLIEAGSHHLAVTLPKEHIYLDADAVRLAQVFTNLLNNAAKYTEKGGHIQLAAQCVDEDVLVSVADDGIGIDREMLPRLFARFAQAHSALERSQGGLGIGLSLVKELVSMHGGSVHARSPGRGLGSEFIVRLPVLRTESRSKTVGQPDRAASPPSCRIVVADDNQDAAESLARVLRSLGNEVLTANDGHQAVEAAEQFRPDVAILDIGMPRLNGYEAAQQIRQKPWGNAIMLVAMTGWGQEEDKRRTRNAGFDHHLVKPANLAELKKLLSERAGRSGTG